MKYTKGIVATSHVDLHGDRLTRLYLYVLAYSRGARDWGVGRQRLGFEGSELLDGFSPDWHHIFPRAYLRENEIPEKDINLMANIAVVRPETNIRIGKKEPMSYMQRYNIDDELLQQQSIPTDRSMFCADKYYDFLETRAEMLADASNAFFSRLERGDD